MTHETELQQIYQATKLLPKGEPMPKFEPETKQWLCTHPKGPLGQGLTPIDAFLAYCRLSQMDAERTSIGTGDLWRPIVIFLENSGSPEPIEKDEVMACYNSL